MRFDGVRRDAFPRERELTTTPEQPVELYMAWRRDNANPATEPMRRLCMEVMAA